jgi:hypothetical protein
MKVGENYKEWDEWEYGTCWVESNLGKRYQYKARRHKINDVVQFSNGFNSNIIWFSFHECWWCNFENLKRVRKRKLNNLKNLVWE